MNPEKNIRPLPPRVLLAEDDPLECRVIADTLKKWQLDVTVCDTGSEAWNELQKDRRPLLAILDWMMPALTGVELCRMARNDGRTQALYLILLTARDRSDDIVEGLEAGANDYIIKPFDQKELRARVDVGLRVLKLETALARRIQQLENALAQVEQLEGLLPICAYCKKVRSDNDYWQQVDHYLAAHSKVRFSHGICPECYRKIVKEEFDEDVE
jgi:PleD family two-component response regulator